MIPPTVYCARFPIAGPLLHPTAADYALEAARLKEQALIVWQLSGSTKLYEVARRYLRTSRLKAWAEQQAEQRAKPAEAA